jgi:uncharacterized protein YxeA
MKELMAIVTILISLLLIPSLSLGQDSYFEASQPNSAAYLDDHTHSLHDNSFENYDEDSYSEASQPNSAAYLDDHTYSLHDNSFENYDEDSYSEASQPNSAACPVDNTYSQHDNSIENNADTPESHWDGANRPLYHEDGSCINIKFHEGISYSGDIIPTGSICLIYSDHYKWLVHDYRIDFHPHIVGFSNTKPVEMFRCYYANYYHVLGTSLIMSIENPEIISMNVPISCTDGACIAS